MHYTLTCIVAYGTALSFIHPISLSYRYCVASCPVHFMVSVCLSHPYPPITPQHVHTQTPHTHVVCSLVAKKVFCGSVYPHTYRADSLAGRKPRISPTYV